MLLAPNFDSSEFDVNEIVPDQYRPNLAPLAQLLQQARDLTNSVVDGGSRCKITSVYRDPARNANTPRAVSNSQHLQAKAADEIFLDIGKQTVARLIRQAKADGTFTQFSQAIFYTDTPHVHLGLPFTNGEPNGQLLVHYKDASRPGGRSPANPDDVNYEVLSDENIGDISDDPPNP